MILKGVLYAMQVSGLKGDAPRAVVDRIMVPHALLNFRGSMSWMVLASTYVSTLVSYTPERKTAAWKAWKAWK